MFNDTNYKQYLKGQNVVLVEGQSCANCISVRHELISLKEQMQFNLILVQATEDVKGFLKTYEVQSVPTIMIFEDDKAIAKAKGYQPMEILQLWIEAKLEKR